MAAKNGGKGKGRASKRKAPKRKPAKAKAAKAKTTKAKVPKRRPAKPTVVEAVRAPSSATMRGPADRFSTILEDRGPNVVACGQLELASGGNPDRPTPYTVATFSARIAAEALAQRFTDIDATAAVEP